MGISVSARRGCHHGSAVTDVTVGPASAADLEAYAIRVVRALAQQWPGCPLTPYEVWEVAYDTAVRMRPAWYRPGVMLRIIRELRACGWAIDPWYFDLPVGLIRREFPETAPPQGPPPTLAQPLKPRPSLRRARPRCRRKGT